MEQKITNSLCLNLIIYDKKGGINMINVLSIIGLMLALANTIALITFSDAFTKNYLNKRKGGK